MKFKGRTLFDFLEIVAFSTALLFAPLLSRDPSEALLGMVGGGAVILLLRWFILLKVSSIHNVAAATEWLTIGYFLLLSWICYGILGGYAAALKSGGLFLGRAFLTHAVDFSGIFMLGLRILYYFKTPLAEKAVLLVLTSEDREWSPRQIQCAAPLNKYLIRNGLACLETAGFIQQKRRESLPCGCVMRYYEATPKGCLKALRWGPKPGFATSR